MKPFVHLHLHTQYSLLDGAAKISKIFKACHEKGMKAVAITDHGNMYGVVKFINEAKQFNKGLPKEEQVKPIIGCEFYVCEDINAKNGKPDYGHLILLAKNQEGYQNLVKLNSIAFVDGFYYKPRIDYKILKEHSAGLVCLSACLAGHIPSFLLQNRDAEAEKKALELKAMFEPNDFYIEIQDHGIPEEKQVLPKLIDLARKLNIGLVATNDVHYVKKEEWEMQDVMLCIQTRKKIDDVDRMKMLTHEFYLKNYDEMLELFPFIPEALENTNIIAEKCNATVFTKLPLTPKFDTKSSETADEMLKRLVYEGVYRKYKEITKTILDRAEYEINVICKMGYADYFLIVWDFVADAEQKDIPVGPGRGSAAGSLVSYALDITKIEPLQYDLLFERFLNPDRISMPDIDLDFCYNRRTEVIDYVTNLYHRENVCQIITFGTLQAKAAIKDTARVLNVPYSEVNAITKLMVKTTGDYKKDPIRKMFGVELSSENEKLIIPDLKKLYDERPLIKKVIDLAIRLEGMPRNTSVHAAGVVICREVLSDYIPIAKNGGEITTQYEYPEIEDIGMLKMDFLALKTLTDLKRTTNLIKENYGIVIDFYNNFNYNDPEVYKVITSGNTDAIFQLESGGMKKFMKDLKPNCMEDIIAGIAMYRPGPMNTIPTFVKNKMNPDKIVYDVPALESILKPTYGCIVYQEQVMRIVQDLAGYSLAQADFVRKMMSKKKMDDLKAEREVFLRGNEDAKPKIEGCLKRGVSEEIGNALWDKMQAFGEYAFNKSHSAVYAYVAYQTAFLKRYYEPEFVASVLNNRITSSDDLKTYIAYAKKREIEILPPDINESVGMFTVKNNKIRFGLAALKNVGNAALDSLFKKREENGKFTSFYEFIDSMEGASLNKRFIESMIFSGALDSFNLKRSQMIQMYPAIIDKINADRKNAASGQFSFFGMEELKKDDEISVPNIPEFNEKIKLNYEKEIVGTYISGHPLYAFAERISDVTFNSSMIKKDVDDDEENIEIFSVEEDSENSFGLENNMKITAAGIVVEIKRILTKKDSKEMAIITIEDLYGTFELMMFPGTYEKFKNELNEEDIVYIQGKISVRGGEAPIILCEKLDILKQVENEVKIVDKNLSFIGEDEIVVQKLYLKYSTLDSFLNDKILNILSAHIGSSDVIIKCTEKNAAFKASLKVDINDLLIFELQAFLNSENIIVK